MKLGTLTIKGKKAIEVDGLFLGFCDTTLKFIITEQGFIRENKLFRTFDQNYLAEILGFINYKTNLKYEV